MAEGHPLGRDASLGRAVSCSRERVPVRDVAMSHQELTPHPRGKAALAQREGAEETAWCPPLLTLTLQGSSQ